MDGIQSGGTADLADHPYGEYRFDLHDDRLTVQGFNQQGRTNLAAYAILRDSHCRFAQRVAEDTINRRCPALLSAAMVTSITPVLTAASASESMDIAPPATAVREAPETVRTDPALMSDPPATAAGSLVTPAAVTSARETSPPAPTR
eukprot:GHVR01044577.1.p1 GENE.GHVR01044577.1~~GHVR01044577.1.p1  ORF type:complete len:147 (-),score=18.72 GHVR01044577.1:163-603(-)